MTLGALFATTLTTCSEVGLQPPQPQIEACKDAFQTRAIRVLVQMVPLSPRVCQKQSPGAGITPVSERLQFSRLDGYLVWQADADNPGSWPFHCHIAWHASTGWSFDVREQPNQIQNLNIPDSSYRLCQDWQAFAATGEVDQIDAGLSRATDSLGLALIGNPITLLRKGRWTGLKLQTWRRDRRRIDCVRQDGDYILRILR